MDPVKLEKVQAVTKFRTARQFLIIKKLTLYAITTCMISLILSQPLGFPPLKSFLLDIVPRIASLVISPKFIFVMSNIIVALLIGETKFQAGSADQKMKESGSEMSSDCYEEYVRLQKSYQRVSSSPAGASHKLTDSNYIDQKGLRSDIEEEEEEEEEEEGDEEHELDDEEYLVMEEDNQDEIEEELKEEDHDQSCGWSTDELNKRVEDFIARFNHQRRLEDKLL